MPTVRIFSLKPDYDRLAGRRRDVVNAMRAATSIALQEDTVFVDAHWSAPIEPGDATNNVLPYVIDVELDATLDLQEIEKLADSLLWVFIDDPYIVPHIPSGITIGVRIKTPGRFFWKEKTTSKDRIIGQQSVFPFFDGDRRLIVIAPDHPDAPFDDRRHHEHYWDISTVTAAGEILAARNARQDTDPEHLWDVVSEALYQSISSNETDNRTREIKLWLGLVHKAYRERIASTPTVEAT